jgi:hypothetical protein
LTYASNHVRSQGGPMPVITFDELNDVSHRCDVEPEPTSGEADGMEPLLDEIGGQKGFVVHTDGPVPDGWRVVEVWDSQADGYHMPPNDRVPRGSGATRQQHVPRPGQQAKALQALHGTLTKAECLNGPRSRGRASGMYLE